MKTDRNGESVGFMHAALRALGNEEMPARISVPSGEYLHARTLKHTFFAAVGIYTGPEGKAVFKIGRTASLFGLPLRWVGRWLSMRELRIYRLVDDLPGVPRCLGAFEDIGLGHIYVEGRPLRRGETTEPEFFTELEKLLEEIHRREIAYVDLSKAENILVGEDGRAYLIDFQISWVWPVRPGLRRGARRMIPHRVGRFVLRELQRADTYHLRKHWIRSARQRPETSPLESPPRHTALIGLHRLIRVPYRALRRRFVKPARETEGPDVDDRD